MASIGYFFSPIYTKFALSTFGWEKTLNTYLYFVLFGMIAAIFLREIKKKKNTSDSIKTDNQTLSEALKESFNHKGFILLIIGFFVCGFNITLVSAHIPSYIQERGFEIWTAAAILSLIGLFNVFGTLTFGYLSGKYSKKILYSRPPLSMLHHSGLCFLPSSCTSSAPSLGVTQYQAGEIHSTRLHACRQEKSVVTCVPTPREAQ